MTSQHQVKNPSLKCKKYLCLLSLMYEDESAIIELMFQANILGSFLQKRGPSLRIPAVFHSKQVVAAAIWTHTSLIEDIFQEPFSAAPTHGAGMASACLPVQTAQLHSPEVLICIFYLLPSFSFSHRQRIAKILPVFHLFRGRRKRKFLVLGDSSCNPQSLAATRISYLGMTLFQTFAAVQNWKRTHCWHP